MDRRAGRMAQRLGGPTARRRRHQRVAVFGAVLLGVAVALVVLGGDDGDDGDDGSDASADDGFIANATALCEEYGDRIQREYALSFPEGPINDAAAAEYLSRAFADTLSGLVDQLWALAPEGEADEVIDALAARVDDVRDFPEEYVLTNPLDGIAARFDEVGLPACGSEFLAPPE